MRQVVGGEGGKIFSKKRWEVGHVASWLVGARGWLVGASNSLSLSLSLGIQRILELEERRGKWGVVLTIGDGVGVPSSDVASATTSGAMLLLWRHFGVDIPRQRQEHAHEHRTIVVLHAVVLC
jgi:hypothetical protein